MREPRVLSRRLFQDGSFKTPFLDRYVSDGTIKMFAYLVLLYDPRPHPLLCVEEPENQLYPKLMAIVVKANILSLCAKAEKPDVLVRIACRELESCYLADLAAVENGLELSGIAKHQGKQKYRSPDYLGSPSSELARLTKERYQKVGGSRAIGPWLDPENVRSDSFRNLVTGIRQIGAEAAP